MTADHKIPRWGVLLPTFDPFRNGRFPIAEGAKVAEDCGFDCAWVGDHLSYKAPVIEPFVAAGVAVGATTRLKLGFSVLLMPMRPVVWVAKQLTSLCTLAPGRIIFGVGVGGEGPEEWEAAGVPMNERGKRLDEGLEMLGPLLRGEALDHPGPLLPLKTPPLTPFPAERPPIIMGGRSEAAVRRTVRHGDGWMAVWLTPEKLAERVAHLKETAEAMGRPVPEVLMMVFTNVCDDLTKGRAESDGLYRGQYQLDYERVGHWQAIGPPERMAEQLAPFADAGADGYVFVPASPDYLGQYERLAEVKALLEKR